MAMTVEQVLKSARELSPGEQRELLRRLATEVVADDERHPVWQLADDIANELAAAGVELPEDGAAQHDHYIYGTPNFTLIPG